MAAFMAYQNKGEYDKALKALIAIHQRLPNTEWGKRAYYHQGEFLYAAGQLKDAQKIFETCLQKYNSTWLARGAAQYLEMIESKELQ